MTPRLLLAAALAACTAAAVPAIAGADKADYPCLRACDELYKWSPEGLVGTSDPDVLELGNDCMLTHCADELELCLTDHAEDVLADFGRQETLTQVYPDYSIYPPTNCPVEQADGLACGRRYVVNKPPPNRPPPKLAPTLWLVATLDENDDTGGGLALEQPIRPRLSAQFEVAREERDFELPDASYFAASLRYYLTESRFRPFVGAGIGARVGLEASDPAVQLSAGWEWTVRRSTHLGLEARYRDFELAGPEWQALLRVGLGGRSSER